MTAKEFLSRAYLLDQQIKSKLEQLESLRALALKCTASSDGERVSASSDPKKFEGVMVKIIDMETEISDDIERLVDIKKEISKSIATVESTAHRLLLEYRYILCKTWVDIADELGYTERAIFIMHGKVLKKFNFF